MSKSNFKIADELATEVDEALRCRGCHATVRGAILDGIELCSPAVDEIERLRHFRDAVLTLWDTEDDSVDEAMAGLDVQTCVDKEQALRAAANATTLEDVGA